jgi:hypothetical protein
MFQEKNMQEFTGSLCVLYVPHIYLLVKRFIKIKLSWNAELSVLHQKKNIGLFYCKNWRIIKNRYILVLQVYRKRLRYSE